MNYTWDQYENLTQWQDFDDYLTETFAYDDLNRLTSVSLPTGVENSFGYDLLGDMTSKADVGTYSFPAAGQAHPHGVASIAMAAGGTTTLAYDYDGQLTSETGPITRTIGWTLFNKVASGVYAGNSNQFQYDADERIVYFAGPSANVVYLPDGDVVTNSKSHALNWHTYAMVDGQRTVEFTGATGALAHEYLHHDDQGSVMVVTDDTFNPATAQPQFSNAGYDAYGQPRSQNGAVAPTWGSAAGYIDQRMVNADQLINLNARFYDPQVGEFLSPDPIIDDESDSQAWNGYSYSGNNPVSREDPTGLDYPSPGTGTLIGGDTNIGDAIGCYGNCGYGGGGGSTANSGDGSNATRFTLSFQGQAFASIIEPDGGQAFSAAPVVGDQGQPIANISIAAGAYGFSLTPNFNINYTTSTESSVGNTTSDQIHGHTVPIGLGQCNGCEQVADVTINDFYQNVFGTGHVGIGVNTNKTQGFYPKSSSIGEELLEAIGVGVPGAVKYDNLNEPHRSYVIRTTPAEDKAVQDYIDQRAANPGLYRLWGRNCAGFCEGGLGAAGLQAPTTILPNLMFDQLTRSAH